MAIAIVEEYKELARDAHGNYMPVPVGPALATQSVTYSTSAAVSNAFNKNTRFIFIQTDDTKAHVEFGASPTATAADILIPAGGGRYFGVRPDLDLKVALYDGSS